MAATASAALASADRELVITRIFDAPRPLVFEAWIEPLRAAQWWGPQGFTIISCEMDVRPGGAWRRCMRSPEGTTHWKQGIYREIIKPERLVFTYGSGDAEDDPGPETLVTVTFADFGSKTKLTLRQALFETRAARASHEGGWTGCLERFAQYLANG